jgi:plasmid stability protein
MRTTIDLPADLMHAAKVRAAQHGESLKELFTRAIAHEVGAAGRVRSPGRVAFPLIGTASDPRVDITSADIADGLETEDVERYRQ